jgi:hypothetical protein
MYYPGICIDAEENQETHFSEQSVVRPVFEPRNSWMQMQNVAATPDWS